MGHQARREFDATVKAIREAREFLRTAINGRVGTEMESDLVLALSELATNAVRHAQTPFEVGVEMNGHIRIEVADRSTKALVPRQPSGTGGRGIRIVDQVCDRWGVRIVEGRKYVWCERDLNNG